MIKLKNILFEQKLGKNWYNLSEDPTFVNYIKKVEGLSLKAYKLGDGMITIGYGHAENIKNSRYKIGDTITKKEAELILRLDIEEHEMRVDAWMKSQGYGDIQLSKLQKSMLTDYAFNPGLSIFKNFGKAVVSKDWDRVKKEYIRTSKGKPLGRNKIFKQTFLDKVGSKQTKKVTPGASNVISKSLKGNIYIVQSGDTLSSIAAEQPVGITIDTIAAANNIDLNNPKIIPGQKLIIK